MKMKYHASVEQTSAHPSLRELYARSLVPELHDVTTPSIQKEPESRQSLRSPRLIGERAHRFHFLDTSSIDYLQVDGNYVTIHVGEDRYLTRATLKYLSDVLTPYDFMRIDRSLLINLQQVDYIERLESGRFGFQLHCGRYLVSNRERGGAILRLLRSGVF
ncbi:LytTR family DNA-binding domain-containing protein [Steroidobacter flavus]|uniref:LytTR family DNA-binding domain-containing protein n=1 Tax=Steroidobacter flavus TaxID=1842136 RepID=A0ABV8SSU2_9GAMM